MRTRDQLIEAAVRVALRDDADGAAASDRIAGAVTRRLGALGVECPAVAVTVVDAIEQAPAGKLRIVVPDRSGAYAAAGGMF
jgi:hypothetical protein